jgi:hypothetical protein
MIDAARGRHRLRQGLNEMGYVVGRNVAVRVILAARIGGTSLKE